MIDLCHCGHADTTHHEKRHSCLGVQCECPMYRDSEKPDEHNPRRVRPSHIAECLCYDCMHGGRVAPP